MKLHLILIASKHHRRFVEAQCNIKSFLSVIGKLSTCRAVRSSGQLHCQVFEPQPCVRLHHNTFIWCFVGVLIQLHRLKWNRYVVCVRYVSIVLFRNSALYAFISFFKLSGKLTISQFTWTRRNTHVYARPVYWNARVSSHAYTLRKIR